jgi:predicted N-acetyltransferase YhbS
MHIRPATPADAARLTAIAHAAKARWDYPAEWLRAWSAELTLSAEYLTAHRVFVAEAAGDAVGVCVLEDHRTHWMLEHLWVDPRAAGDGIGGTLLLHALETARAHRPGRIRVRADPFAEGFYLKFGARRVGEDPAPMPGAPTRRLPVLEFAV